MSGDHCGNCGKLLIEPTQESFCSRRCSNVFRKSALADRFAQYVGPADPNGCLPWIGRIGTNGYGAIRGENAEYLTAHRVAWMLANGPIPAGMCVLHRCDNRICVNVTHLFLGTKAVNNADCAAKGRTNKGEDRPQSKLTEQAVRDIRQRYAAGGEMYLGLGREYGVDPSLIARIVKRKAWRHVK